MKKIIMIFLIFCFLFILLGAGNGSGEVEPIILIEDSGPEYKIFSFTTEVINYSRVFRKPFNIGEDDAKKIGKDGVNLLNCLFQIPGVVAVIIEPYEIIIKRSRAFEWGEIESKVLENLKECFGKDRNKVKIIRPKSW